jgi:hypothetical protein
VYGLLDFGFWILDVCVVMTVGPRDLLLRTVSPSSLLPPFGSLFVFGLSSPR